MKTYELDFIRVHFAIGVQDIWLEALDMTWPPPEILTEINGVKLPEPMRRIRMSSLDDDAMAKVGKRIARGAEYKYISQV